MKKFRLLFASVIIGLLLLGNSVCSFGQVQGVWNSDVWSWNFSVTTGWTYVKTTSSAITPVVSTTMPTVFPIDPGVVVPNYGYITNLQGYYDNRIFRTISTTLNSTWKMEFPVKVTSMSSTGGCFIPMALTAGTMAPLTRNMSTTLQTNQDAIGVVCVSDLGTSTNYHIRPFVKDGQTIIPLKCNGIPISSSLLNQTFDLNQGYSILLERVSLTKGKITVTNNDLVPAVVILSYCFDINTPSIVEYGVTPVNVTSLSTLQISSACEASNLRTVSATLSTYKLTRNYNLICCAPVIKGNQSVCASQSATFSYGIPNCAPLIGNNSGNYTWVYPSELTVTGQNTGYLTVTGWGGLTGVVTIKLIWYCNCEQQTPIVFNVNVSGSCRTINTNEEPSRTTGEIENITESIAVKLYPNPASNLITIEVPKEEYKTLTILNMLGAEVFKQDIENNDEFIQIPVTQLKSGIYHVIVNGEKNSSVTRFVKN